MYPSYMGTEHGPNVARHMRKRKGEWKWTLVIYLIPLVAIAAMFSLPTPNNPRGVLCENAGVLCVFN